MGVLIYAVGAGLTFAFLWAEYPIASRKDRLGLLAATLLWPILWFVGAIVGGGEPEE